MNQTAPDTPATAIDWYDAHADEVSVGYEELDPAYCRASEPTYVDE